MEEAILKSVSYMVMKRECKGTEGLAPLLIVTPRPGPQDFRPDNGSVTYLTSEKVLPGKGMPFGNMTLDHQRFGNHQTSPSLHPYSTNGPTEAESVQFDTCFLTIQAD